MGGVLGTVASAAFPAIAMSKALIDAGSGAVGGGSPASPTGTGFAPAAPTVGGMSGTIGSAPAGLEQTQLIPDTSGTIANTSAAYDRRQAQHRQHSLGQLSQNPDFIGGMGGWHGPNTFNGQMPAAPPPQWSYQAGHGPVWQEAHRAINPNAPDKTSQNWSMGSPAAGSIFTGNRI